MDEGWTKDDKSLSEVPPWRFHRKRLRMAPSDITFYLRERERVQTYEQVDLQALPPDMKRLLAEGIDQMMKSDKM